MRSEEGGGRRFSIGELGRTSGLSRSALLYYDRIGLLKPSGRTGSNYRYYTEADLERLRRLRLFRELGLSLAELTCLLDGPCGLGPGGPGPEAAGEEFAAVLERRLEALNAEMQNLDVQRRTIGRMLAREDRGSERAYGGAFLEAIHSVGLDEETRDALHAEFERLAPEDHERFLRFIGLDPGSIGLVRAKARSSEGKARP